MITPQADPNAETIGAYENGWRKYLAGTPPVALDIHGPWLPSALALRPAGSTVLEIGSGPGHDAILIESTGAHVERTDATAAFVNHLRSQGHKARLLNVLTDEIGTGYGMIYAFAVFQHFTWPQFRTALGRCRDALEPGGVLAFSMRRGEGGVFGGGWRERKGMDRRFFMFWQPGQLWDQVEKAGLRVVTLHQDEAVWQDSDEERKTWLLTTAVRD